MVTIIEKISMVNDNTGDKYNNILYDKHKKEENKSISFREIFQKEKDKV